MRDSGFLKISIGGCWLAAAVLLAGLAGWSDAWTRLRPGEAGHTYDLEANPLAREHAFAAEGSRRLDRILTSALLVPVAVGMAGQSGGKPGPPSDHLGFWADLDIAPKPPP